MGRPRIHLGLFVHRVDGDFEEAQEASARASQV
jgi:hypothetical protein